MGLYDVVLVPCPNCGKDYEAQSKGGYCELKVFDLHTCPRDVFYDVNRHAPFSCECGCEFNVDERTKGVFFLNKHQLIVNKSGITVTVYVHRNGLGYFNKVLNNLKFKDSEIDIKHIPIFSSPGTNSFPVNVPIDLYLVFEKLFFNIIEGK